MIKLSLAILLAIFSGWVYFHHPQPPSTVATVLTAPRALTDFSLMGMDGQPFTPQQLKGEWHWIFFGFTRCPQLCPDTLAKLAKAYQDLQKKGVTPLPQIVFVSIDPNDTPKQIEQYMQRFEKQFYGVTGDEKEIKALAKQLALYYQTSEVIDHSGAVMMVNSRGEWQGIMNPPFTVAQLVSAHQAFIH